MNPGPAGAHVSATRRTSHQPTISIVVPARNEARNLLLVLPELPPVYEVILVDGHSTDGTAEAALSVMPEIRIIQQTRKGKGNALACGFEAATGDIIVMFDADGSADPAELPDCRCSRGWCGLCERQSVLRRWGQSRHHTPAPLGKLRLEQPDQRVVRAEVQRPLLWLQRILEGHAAAARVAGCRPRTAGWKGNALGGRL